MSFSIDDLKVGLTNLSYLSTKTDRHNYKRMKNTIQKLVAEEKYNLFVAASHQTRLDTMPGLKLGLGEGKVGHEPKLVSCWSMLVIDPLSAMWAWWALLVLDPNLGPGTYAW